MTGKTEETTGFIYKNDGLLSEVPLAIMISKGLGPDSSIEAGTGRFTTDVPCYAEPGERLKMELLDGTYEIEITSMTIEASGQSVHHFRVVRRLSDHTPRP